MPLKIIRQDHYELLGEGYVLLTAPHAASPEADLYTGQIVEDAALASRSYAIIGKVSRDYVGLNRVQTAQTEFRKSIEAMIEDNEIRCILDIHGKKAPGVDIGTGLRETASTLTTDLVRVRLSQDFAVKINEQYSGLKPASIISNYSGKTFQGKFTMEVLQLEFGHQERHDEREKVVNGIAELVTLINRRLG